MAQFPKLTTRAYDAVRQDIRNGDVLMACLLYTSDAADE